jgi:adenosylcobinamide-GDP ribazoletransferase
MPPMVNDLRAALGLLTILPGGPLPEKPGAAVAWFPVVGLILGAVVAGAAWLAGWLLPAAAAPAVAFLVLLVWVALTGGLHLDGLADACDGLLATVAPARRLEIMQDPRAGSWAVIGVGLLLLGKWSALLPLLSAAQADAWLPLLLVLPPVVGRGAMAFALAGWPSARPGGMGDAFRNGLGTRQLAAALVTVLLVAIACRIAFGPPAIISTTLGLVAGWSVAAWGARRLGGGLTGDVYGAACEIAELVCLLELLWAI